MSTPKVLIAGKDIYPDYVEKLQNITKEKTYDKISLICNEYALPVLNRDNQFSVNNPKSMFHGIDWIYLPIEIIDKDGETDWLGNLVRISRNHLSAHAVLISKDSYYKFKDNIVDYESSTWELGVDAFKNLCDQMGYDDYDIASYWKSYSILETANCYIKCNFNKSSNVTFQNAINQIALKSNAYVYTNNNQMHFKVFEYHIGGVHFSVSDNDLKAPKNVDEDIVSLYNDFSISYFDDLGTPATDTANIGLISRQKYGTKAFVIRGDNNSQIVFRDLISAQYVGKGKIRRVHKNLLTNPKPLSFINFGLFKDFENRLTIDSFFHITLAKEDWTNKVFEPFKYTISQEKNDIQILAYEVASE